MKNFKTIFSDARLTTLVEQVVLYS